MLDEGTFKTGSYILPRIYGGLKGEPEGTDGFVDMSQTEFAEGIELQSQIAIANLLKVDPIRFMILTSMAASILNFGDEDSTKEEWQKNMDETFLDYVDCPAEYAVLAVILTGIFKREKYNVDKMMPYMTGNGRGTDKITEDEMANTPEMQNAMMARHFSECDWTQGTEKGMMYQ